MVKTTLKIDGMMCGMCESHVNDSIRKSFAVKKVTSNHSKGETVIVSEAPLAEDQLKSCTAAIGYTVRAITSEPYEKKGLFGWFGGGK
ncbi:MAG: ATPase P [Gemmiger sp.]|nr:ATPase P [Gemmiger sp.]